ncbi:terminase large subunit [Brevibacillus laterosporus]|uniref:terminase large subunit n=1 Tax=Brevibacillus laterosporus TaxID=1465 RepID=UPI002E1D86A3|nr:terminase TerL endonuclease subunit [Brevibacillus laterosporus]MED1786158.1 terminase large subunit [Brevibacillus laterosporus]
MIKQFLIDYSLDVLDGEVIACKKHKWACQRFLRDIEREGTDEFPYIFDDEKALRFFQWMNLFRHTKGVLVGEKIEPHEIQYFVFGNIYGWVHRVTGYRRFKKAYWQVGRKNAKSQSLSCVASYEAMALGENMSEVYCAATKKDQAKIVWKETKAMLDGCSELKGKYKVAYGEIVHPKSQSIIKPLSKQDGKTGDGLNPQCGIIDEYHAHETDEIYEVIDSGMISRAQPLLVIITTAGTNLNAPCYRSEYDYVSRLLDPNRHETENEEYFALVNELDKDEEGNLIDDIKDESVWGKANPIACSYPEGIENIRSKLVEALEKPEKMGKFLTKNMDVWVNFSAASYMPMNKWHSCSIILPTVDIKRFPCYIGMDLSITTDITSIGGVHPLGDDMFFVWQHSFIPKEKLAERMKTDKAPYDLWIKQGWLEVTPGEVVDYSFVEAYLKRIRDEGYKILEVDYDQYNATHLAQTLDSDGFEMVAIPQSIKHLSEPTKSFRDHVYQKKIIHAGDGMLAWAIGNAVTKVDSEENMKLDKKKSKDRIDPIAAVINGFTRAMGQEDNRSVYEKREPRSL